LSHRLTAFKHPFFLTLVILYSAALSGALAVFPPLRWPIMATDILSAAMLLMFICFIALSYAHGRVSQGYSVGLFALKASVATLFAWSFRLLDAAGQNLVSHVSPRRPLLLFYICCICQFATMVLFSRWTKHDMKGRRRIDHDHQYVWPRTLGFVAVMCGGVIESVAPVWQHLNNVLFTARYIVAFSMLGLSIYYFASKPWALFDGNT
jgi:hypothetical protein